MRRISRRRLALLVPAFFVFRVAYFTAFGALNGFGTAAIVDALAMEVRQFVLTALVIFVAVCRPTGSGTLVAAVRSLGGRGELPDCDAIDCRQLALEAVGLVVGTVGFVGVAFFAEVPGRYVGRQSLAGFVGVESVAGLGSNAFFLFMVLGVVLWGVAWVVDGLSLSTEPVYRQTD